jgi:hypothetical protein
MEAMREHWTDDRMDDLARRVDNGFNRVDKDLRDLRGEIAAMRSETNSRFEGLEARFDALQRLLLQVAGGMIAAFLAGLLGLIATQL